MRENPYRLFFPLSWLGAFALAFVWIPAVLIERHFLTIPGWNAYPRDLHSTLAAGVFVLPAMTGFLLTAAPRMTGSSPASMIWVVALFFCEILIPPSVLLGGTAIALLGACAILSAFL
ncbi:MAG TPA: NnrS family protein, partial [Leptospiraceae bacterium]|nr:NnrS family protein [Leptospiraceae bacterium]